ncbi:hypothetical protein [Dysgonomonas macrotermitis]|uniref:Uncharacterized protein n=1 Tax=Dysgonomonas macrotermitis TaxID=1346286 RepID=A0A1M5J923_9BACT|nr:hypothetical protein [Dysgonomonas macrotermitis]SHG37068.1 hypothetical protein SAMN05444362_12244 [Dysgonomonas macrotermitis]
MSSRYVVQIVIVIASVVLGMFLYPILLRKVIRLVEWMYWNLPGKKEDKKEDKVNKVKPDVNEKTSVIGESRTKIGHSRTKTSSDAENEKVIEKENTFVPETDEDPGLMDDVDVPLERSESLPQEEIDPEEEAIELELEKGAILASGASYDELVNTGQVIAKEKPSDDEKDEAGRVLYENKFTEIVEQVISNDEQTLTKVNTLIRFHMKKHNLNQEEGISGSEEFESFDINSIF